MGEPRQNGLTLHLGIAISVHHASVIGCSLSSVLLIRRLHRISSYNELTITLALDLKFCANPNTHVKSTQLMGWYALLLST